MLAGLGIKPIGWDIDPQDWRLQERAQDRGLRRERTCATLHGRAIVLFHDVQAATVVALPHILDWIDQENARRTAAGQPPIKIIDYAYLLPERKLVPPFLDALGARARRPRQQAVAVTDAPVARLGPAACLASGPGVALAVLERACRCSRSAKSSPTTCEGLHAVASHLDTVNLPNDRDSPREADRPVAASRSPASSTCSSASTCSCSSTTRDKIIGTSMIHAQHGTRRAPHIFFDVMHRRALLRDARQALHPPGPAHRLQLQRPDGDRRAGAACRPIARNTERARQVAVVRALPLHRAAPRVVPRRGAVGAVAAARGRRHVGVVGGARPPLHRHDAIRRPTASRRSNKEFIRALFPAELDLHLAAAASRCRALIGQVGPDTKGVEKMLRRIGFEYAERIDPFDGGPHFIAKTDDITLVKATTPRARWSRCPRRRRRARSAGWSRSSAIARRTSPPPARASGSKAPTSACRRRRMKRSPGARRRASACCRSE